MNLEYYKKRVKAILSKSTSIETTIILMKEYERDFTMFLEKKYTAGQAATLMLAGY